MTVDELTFRDLERRFDALENLVTKLQAELLKASKYKHENPVTDLEGVKVFLGRAGEVKGRERYRGRKR